MNDIIDSSQSSTNDPAQMADPLLTNEEKVANEGSPGDIVVPAGSTPLPPDILEPPSPPPPPDPVTEQPMKAEKSKKTPIIALTILFIFISTGLVFVFVNQQQSLNDIRNRAIGGLYPDGDACTYDSQCESGFCDGPKGVCWPNPKIPDGGNCTNDRQCVSGNCDPTKGVCWPNSGSCGIGCANGYTCDAGNCIPNPITDTCGRDVDTGAPVCCTPGVVCAPSDIVCEPPARKECKTTGSNGTKWCLLEANSSWCGGGGTPKPTGGGSENTPTPTRVIVNTLTPTVIIAQCVNIKVYKNGVVVTPSTLKTGDAVVIAVTGGNAVKARVRINGGTWTESTTKNSAGEYTVSYTLPSGVTNFTIQSEIYGLDNAWH